MTSSPVSLRIPKQRLGRELAFVVALKLAIIGLAATFIFGPHQRPQLNAAKVEAHIIGSSAVPPHSPPFKNEAKP